MTRRGSVQERHSQSRRVDTVYGGCGAGVHKKCPALCAPSHRVDRTAALVYSYIASRAAQREHAATQLPTHNGAGKTAALGKPKRARILKRHPMDACGRDAGKEGGRHRAQRCTTIRQEAADCVKSVSPRSSCTIKLVAQSAAADVHGLEVQPVRGIQARGGRHDSSNGLPRSPRCDAASDDGVALVAARNDDRRAVCSRHRHSRLPVCACRR